MRRAAVLGCVKIGERQYRVRGQVEEYYDVNVDPACYCLDQRHRGEMCKHEISARLQDGDQKLRQALGDMLLAAEKRADAAEKEAKRLARRQQRQRKAS